MIKSTKEKILEFLHSKTFIFIVKLTLLGIICILLLLDFSSTAKFIKGSHNEVIENKNEASNITISYDKLIKGNSSGNLNMYHQDTPVDYRFCPGSVVIKNDNIYSLQKKGNKHYLMSSNINNPEDGLPILDGYYVKFLNFINKNSLYCVVHPTAPQTTEEDIDQICLINTSNNTTKFFSDLETKEVTSLVSNSNYIYYTEKFSRYIYCVGLEGTNKVPLIKIANDNYSPYIIGIDSTYIYYLTGSNLSRYNYIEKTQEELTTTFTSSLQNVIYADNYIIGYTDLTYSSLTAYNLNTHTENIIITQKELVNSLGGEKIDRINYSSGYLFFSINNNIYYTNINSPIPTIDLLRDLKIDNPVFYLTNEYILTQESEFGTPNAININYILSQ